MFKLFRDKKNKDDVKEVTIDVVEEEAIEEEDIIPDSKPSRGVFVAPPDMRIQDICQRYLLEETCEMEECREFDFAELSVMYVNADVMVEKQYQDNETIKQRLQERKQAIYEIVKEKLMQDAFYVIYVRKTKTPYLYDGEAVFGYWQEFRAKEAVLDLNYHLKEQGPFYAVKVTTDGKDEMLALFQAMGIQSISTDGSKLHIPVTELIKEQTDIVKNPEICRVMELAIQGGPVMTPELRTKYYLSVIGQSIDAKKNFMLCARKVNEEKGEYQVQEVEAPDGRAWVPLFTDEYAFRSFCQEKEYIMESVENIYARILNGNPKVAGIILNPGRENFTMQSAEIQIVLDGKHHDDLKKSDIFYVMYSKAFRAAYPALNANNEAVVVTKKEIAEQLIQDSPEMQLLAKQVRQEDIAEELKNYLSFGANSIILDGTKLSVAGLISKTYPVKDQYLGADLCQAIIHYGQMVIASGETYQKSANMYINLIFHQLYHQVFLTPILYDGEDMKTRIDDKKIHMSPDAKALLEERIKAVSEEADIMDLQKILPFWGGDEYMVAIGEEEKTVYHRILNNGTKDVFPIFTNVTLLKSVFGDNVRLAAITYKDALERGTDYDTIVVDPAGLSFSIPKDMRELIEKKRNEEMK